MNYKRSFIVISLILFGFWSEQVCVITFFCHMNNSVLEFGFCLYLYQRRLYTSCVLSMLRVQKRKCQQNCDFPQYPPFRNQMFFDIFLETLDLKEPKQ